jgi:hypothetical protein
VEEHPADLRFRDVSASDSRASLQGVIMPTTPQVTVAFDQTLTDRREAEWRYGGFVLGVAVTFVCWSVR